ncbi:hypothetical protein [Mesorhizobium sp.]|uniref:hypothetical protein n=1 Tax=Mesorhizobium sp. TaxID=1871066 RepID=UPI000FE45D1E|nr:hypothetical protein [Mesorhizobium sp.]RWP27333.1 MAG: hypothetical protein EOR03_30945 [Mesorhizobium sp.]TIL68884.1 MAG: hypothetical protein E5Y77_06860 [Mesorhizobium sp.]
MDEFAMTTAGFIPIKMSWTAFYKKIGEFFSISRRDYYRISHIVSVLEVDRFRIVRSLPQEVGEALMARSPEREFWRRINVDINLVTTPITTSFLFLERPKESWIEVRFPSKAFVKITGIGQPGGQFDHEAKAALVSLILQLAGTFQSPGFGYKHVGETELMRPPATDTLRDYVEKSDRWTGDKLGLLMAGLHASLVRAEDFEFDPDDPPMTYAKDGYYLFDSLWPSRYE